MGFPHILTRDLGNKGTGKKSTGKKRYGNKGTGKKVQVKKVPVKKVHKTAWIGKKGTKELDEISKEKCYGLPSEFENSSNSDLNYSNIST